MIKIEGVAPTAAEIRQCSAAWPSTARIAWIQTLTLIGILVTSVVLALSFASPQTAVWTASTAGLLLLALIVSGNVTMSAYARASVDAVRVSGPAQWSIDERGIQMESPTGVASRLWEGVSKVVEEDDRFVFAIAPFYNPVLPKRQMTAEQIVAMKALVADVTASGRLGRGVD